MNEPEVRFSKAVADRLIRVLDEAGQPLAGIQVVRVASNGTYLDGVTDAVGKWTFADPFLGTVTLLVAGTGRAGASVVMENADWGGDLEIRLLPLASGGSEVIREGSGYVPGLNGRLNPIRDSHGRMYIYGDNLSFDQSPDQPFRFDVGKPFSAVDAIDTNFDLTVLAILGRTTLIRYELVNPSPLA